MPVTPVGQIPYPLSSDKPLIPTDMRNLALVTDGWVSNMDTALDGRVTAVGTRLDSVTTRLSATTANLATANTTMTTGDTGITNEQTSLTSTENRLNSQDTTANALQTRYNTDNNNLTNFTQLTPLGVAKIIPGGSTTTSSSSSLFWLSSSVFNINYAQNPAFLVTFSVNFRANNYNTGWIEFRICSGVGMSGNPAWGSYYAQASFTQPVSQNPQSFMMRAAVRTGTINNSGALIALGCIGDGTLNYSVNVNSGSIQYLTTNG